eukprot:gene4800-4294_t
MSSSDEGVIRRGFGAPDRATAAGSSGECDARSQGAPANCPS